MDKITTEEAVNLAAVVGRIEKLEAEKEVISDHIKEIYQRDVKAAGFDPAIVRKVVALRKKDPREVETEADLVEIYLRALDGGGGQ